MTVMLTLCLLISPSVFSQTNKVIVIDEGIYKSYFSPSLREPLYVIYTLHYSTATHCEQTFEFTVTRPGTATGKDYAETGQIYDKGHLANAEDFRANCDDLKKTYQYFNCVPQTETLNRGIWKTWEKKIRAESEKTNLLIVCGAIYGTKTIGPDKLVIPDYCWKIVYKESNKKKPIHVLYFPNDESRSVDTTLTVTKLKKKMGYKLKGL
jgi:DNA/RNA endonuclease G (NUC1)